MQYTTHFPPRKSIAPKSFNVIRLCREDLTHILGDRAHTLTDDQMRRICDKTSDALYELDFWGILKDVIDLTLEGE